MSSVGTNKNVPESEPKYNIFQRQRFVVVHLVRYFRGQSRGLCSLNKLRCRLMRCCQPGPKVFVDEAHWVAIFRTPLRWLKPPADFLVGCWLHLARYLPAYVVDVIIKCVIIKCNGGAKGTNHEHSAMTNNSRNKNQSFRRWQATGDEKSLCFEFFQNIAVSLCLQPWASAEFFPGVCNIHIVLILFRLLTIQCNWMFTKVWPFPHHKQNTQCYGNSQKNRASFAAPLLFKQYKTAWLTPYRYQQSLPRCITCQRSLHSTVTCSVARFQKAL